MGSLLEHLNELSDSHSDLVRFWARHPRPLKVVIGLQKKIQHEFANKALLLEALTHRSAITDFLMKYKDVNADQLRWNERLEFLGDSALSLVMTHYLWIQFPNEPEGKLSRLRASLVNEKSLARLGRKLTLGEAVALGQGEERNDGRKRDALIADSLEALLGAVYLDAGFEKVKLVIESLFLKHIDINFETMDDDHKTILQEYVQGKYKSTPTYDLIAKSGPDHQVEFEVAVMVDGQELAKGVGASKKRASQNAAKNALDNIKKTRF